MLLFTHANPDVEARFFTNPNGEHSIDSADHNNYTQFYEWQGPDGNISLPCFRVDSPMKGSVSSKDEARLAFEVITIDMRRRTMTVRECLWNTAPENPGVLRWGQMKTMGL